MSEMLPRLPINGYCFQLPIPLVETIMPHGTLQSVRDNVQSKGRKQIPKYNWNFSFSLIRWNISNRNNLSREKNRTILRVQISISNALTSILTAQFIYAKKWKHAFILHSAKSFFGFWFQFLSFRIIYSCFEFCVSSAKSVPFSPFVYFLSGNLDPTFTNSAINYQRDKLLRKVKMTCRFEIISSSYKPFIILHITYCSWDTNS